MLNVLEFSMLRLIMNVGFCLDLLKNIKFFFF